MANDVQTETLDRARALGGAAGRSLGALVFPRLAADRHPDRLDSEAVLEAFDHAKAMAFLAYFAEVVGLRQTAMADLDQRAGKLTLAVAQELREAATRAADEHSRAALDIRLAQIAEAADGLSRVQSGLQDIAEELLGGTTALRGGNDADRNLEA